MKDAYFYLSSDTGAALYPQNAANNFRVQLPQTLRLDPKYSWSLSVLDIDLPKFSSGYNPKYVTIETGICNLSVCRNGLSPILQRLYIDDLDKQHSITITNPRYVSLNANNFDALDIYINDHLGEPASFESGSVECTLHLTRED